MTDRVTQAGREWMAGEMPGHVYFALVRREARRGRWPWRRLVQRLRTWRP